MILFSTQNQFTHTGIVVTSEIRSFCYECYAQLLHEYYLTHLSSCKFLVQTPVV
jgi:hypothetical protein